MKIKNHLLILTVTMLLVTNNLLTFNNCSFNTSSNNNNNKTIIRGLNKFNQKKNSIFFGGIVYLKVSGFDLNDLKKNLEDKTIRIMERTNYRIKDAKFNSVNLTFSCTLIPDITSSFFKIGLYFGPKANGYCESCSNVIRKNPGALEILKSQDNNYYYSFIAIPK